MTRHKWDRIDERKLMHSRGVEEVRGGDLPFGMGRQKPALRSGYGNVTAAAKWLRENRQRLRDAGKHAVPELQREFGLSGKQACEAIKECNLIAARAT